MTYTRKITRHGNVYLYRVTSYRDKETGKVRQKAEYLGKEVINGNVRTVEEPRNRFSVRKVMESAPYILYRFAEDSGLTGDLEESFKDTTKMPETARRIISMAASTVYGVRGSIDLHTEMSRESDQDKRDLLQFIGSSDPDRISIMERAMSERILEAYGKRAVVYDISAVKYHIDPSFHGLYSSRIGGIRGVNMLLALTGKGGVPIRHHVMQGDFTTLPSLLWFDNELHEMGIDETLIVSDRGFISARVLMDLEGYNIIGAVPAYVEMFRELLAKSRGIEHSRNRIQYRDEPFFYRENNIGSIRYIVYFSARRRVERLEAFHSRISRTERTLREVRAMKFDSEGDIMHVALSAAGKMSRYFDIKVFNGTLIYRQKHNAIQSRINRMGYIVLFTTTTMEADEILRIYMEKDIVENAIMRSGSIVESLQTGTEAVIRGQIFLSILGHSLLKMIANSQDLSYSDAFRILSGIREVVYKNRSHSLVELTREQKSLLERLSINL